MPKFIVGQSVIPSDSGLIRTLLIECPGGFIHDTSPNVEVLYATKDGVGSKMTGPGSHYFLDYIDEPDGFDLDLLDQSGREAVLRSDSQRH